MSNPPTPKTDYNESLTYQIRLKGHLGAEWADWFGGLTLTPDENGEMLITGLALDQAALHGLLKKVRDLGLTLVSVNLADQKENEKIRRQKMDTNRKTAIIVGVLYIIGTVAGVLSVVVTQPILGDPDYLMKISANQNQIVLGAIFVLTMGFALAMVPVMLFPILKKQNEALALGYVVFRGALEAVTYIATVVSWLLLITLSQEYLKAGAPDASYFQTMGTLLHRADDLTYLVPAFPLGALMLYFVLFQSKLIPRWLSVWGFIAIAMNFTAGLLQMFGITSASSSLDTVLNLPLFFQEMVMAVWLIVKGFNSAAVVPARQA